MKPADQVKTIAGLALRWREFGTAPARTFGLWVVVDPDVLLEQITEEEYNATDERMPYFGSIWPAAESLIAKLLDGPELRGVEVLDLGCGLGAVGFAAAACGARVTFMDWEPRALTIAAQSARDQGLPFESTTFFVADWRQPPPMGRFDRILAADVLYEERNVPGVTAFLAAHLKPGAQAWISDPGRPHARRVPALALEHGLNYAGSEILPEQKHHIAVNLIKLERASPATE